MNYIRNTPTGCRVFSKTEQDFSVTQLTYVKNLCLEKLFSLEGYLKAVKKVLGIKYKIPLYLDSKHILFSTRGYREYDAVFINYINIEKVSFEKDIATIIFYDKSELTVKLSKNQYYKYTEKIDRVRKYREMVEVII